MAEPQIFTGKNVEEAIAEGLRVLGLNLAEAEIEIISRGSRGIFGLGSEPAQVRIKPRRMNAAPPLETTVIPAPPSAEEAKPDNLVHQPAAKLDASPVSPSIDTSVAAFLPEEAEEEEKGEPAEATELPTAEEEEQLAQLASELLGNVVRLMGFEARVVAEWHEPDADNDQRYLLLNLHGKDLAPLIGRRGETLNNLQYLVRLMVNQRLHRWKNIVVDVEGYRRRRMEHLAQLALRSAQQVAQTGRALALEPMPASERRIIHLTLRDHPDVITESSGEGERRKVQILPRKQA
uniref:RNA-binding protein KhpB n=1 Tax=Caldilinea aerophila TaxID=133453 RepID=A0A7C1FR68_9CHLR